MKDSKLIQQLQLLNALEFKRFSLFLKSPYFTRSKDVVIFFNFIRKLYPTFDEKKINKQYVFKKLFPKEAYSDIKLRNLQSKLSKIVESYLIQISYEQDAFNRKKKLTQIYGTRNLYSEFERNSIQLTNDLDNQVYRDATYYYNRYQLDQAYYLHINTSKKLANVNYLKSSLHNLQNFYAIEELRLGIDLKNRERIFAESHNFSPNPTLQISENNYLYILLEKCWQLLEENSDSSFYDLKDTFLKYMHQLPLTEGMNIFPVLINYAIQQLGNKDIFYRKEIFDLYKIGLTERLLFANNELSEITFFNIVTVSSNLKEFTFAHQFIQDYEQFLNPTHRMDTKTLSIGILLFNEERFIEVVDALSYFNFSHILNTLIAKSLLARTYYHLFLENPSYIKVLYAHCEAFSRFLGRTTSVSVYKKTSYKNFLFFLKKIIHQKNLMTTDKLTKKKLTLDLESYVTIVAKEWFRKTIQRL